jgi:hypothetical protein
MNPVSSVLCNSEESVEYFDSEESFLNVVVWVLLQQRLLFTREVLSHSFVTILLPIHKG